MRYGSVCSGIEAATAAWHPLGWRASFFSEIEAFPRAVLQHHYPEVPLHGDFTTIKAGEYEPIDLLVGGTPCQSFSVAGLRGGLADDRGNLALEYLRLADRLRPRWLVWENVPGVLSSNGGRDFGAILGGMVELGYGFAYRVLDAKFFGVAQRRRRVFVVGYLGDWRRAAAVLFERHSLSGHPAPRREAGKAAPTIPSRSSGGGGLGTDFDCDGGLIAPTLNATYGEQTGQDYMNGLMVAHTLKGEGFDASEDGTGRGTPIVPVAVHGTQDPDVLTDQAHALGRNQGQENAICFSSKDYGADAEIDLSPTLRAGGHDGSHANAGVPPAIAYGITRDALDRTGEGSGQTPGERAGLGIIEEQAQCLKAKGPGAVAYAVRTNQTGQNGPGYMADLSPSLSSDESVPAVARTIETMYGVSHADASQTGPHQALRTLFEAAGEEAATEWCLGVLAAFWPAEVLRPEVHGRGVRCSAIPQRGLVNVALSRSQAGAAWSVQDLWEAGCNGRAPCGWRPHEQLAGQLGSYLSELPYSPSPAQRLLHDLWCSSEGAGLLREALSALQEARRSACGEVQPAHSGSAVRRLTVEECEALQGFPRSYTLIPWRKGMAPDGPRYKALGNSMAVPVMRWIGERIQQVEAIPAAPSQERAA